MPTSDFKKLEVWKKAMALVKDVYQYVKYLPQEEKYALGDQIRRCVVSIPSNIAEGQARNSNRDFIRFLYISNGSLSELETQLILCVQLGFISESEYSIIECKMIEIGKMLRSLIRTLESKCVS